MKPSAHGFQSFFDFAYGARREARRQELQAPLVRPFRAFVRVGCRVVVAAALLIGFSKASLVEAFFVPSSSMNPTLRVSDYILVPKFLYGLRIPLFDEVVVSWAKPERGDVIVFHKPRPALEGSATDSEAFVKRVIALEQDEVEIRGTQVFVNGVLLEEPYARWVDSNNKAEYRFGPVTVPVGTLFVLGDNRANSEDSRDWPDHFVSISHVVGKAVMVYWSSANDSRVRTVL